MMMVSDLDRIRFRAKFSDQDRILLKFFGSDNQIWISAQHCSTERSRTRLFSWFS